MKLQGKRVVITGASSGIGRLLMRRLVCAGAQVIGVARDVGPIAREFGSDSAIVCDVSSPMQIDAMLDEAERRLGGIDIYVSHAGYAHYGAIGTADWGKAEQLFKTNVLACVYALQKLTEVRRDQKLVFMVTVSALGKMVLPGFALYNATKFALDGFVRTYRMECPENVCVIPVYPVASRTPFFRKAGGPDTPVPFARQSAETTAAAMENGLRYNMRAVYPSLLFVLRCMLARLLPVDLPAQAVEKARFKRWQRRHGEA